jgi:Lipoate-protein ligase A
MLIPLPNALGNAVTNMAIDASLLESIPQGVAVFRHYAWIEPALTFGYAQSYSEVLGIAPPGITPCRRLTGGGIVDHRDDWTYALAIHNTLPVAQREATTVYKDLHAAISRALALQSIPSQPAPCPKACKSAPQRPQQTLPSAPSQCFVTPAANDVLTPQGRKIAGAAMKRNRRGLLIQGSIDRGSLPYNFDYPKFSQDFVTELNQALDLQTSCPDDLRSLFNGPRIQELREQFASVKWNERR